MLWTLTAEHSVVSGVTMIAPQVTLLMAVALQLQCLFSKSYLVNTGAKTEDSKDGPHHSASKLTSSNKALPAYPTDALTRTLTKAIVRHVPGYQEGQEGFLTHIFLSPCYLTLQHPRSSSCPSQAAGVLLRRWLHRLCEHGGGEGVLLCRSHLCWQAVHDSAHQALTPQQELLLISNSEQNMWNME